MDIEMFLELDLSFLNLSTRAYNCLLRQGYQTIGELVIKSTSEIKKIKQLGNVSFEEIINKVHEKGLIFINEDPNLIDKDKYEAILKYQKNSLEEIKTKKIISAELNKNYRELLYSTNILNMSIEKLNLPINIYFDLKGLNINLIGELLNYNTLKLQNKLRDWNEFNILKNFIHSYGFIFVDEKITKEYYELLKENIKLFKEENQELNSEDILLTLEKIKAMRNILLNIMHELNDLNNRIVNVYDEMTKKREK